MQFKLKSDYQPMGDQPQAIEQLVAGVEEGRSDQVLLGVTGSGKTFTIANVIEHVQKPTLILAHNKTLAAQLYQEFRDFFPENAVSYFVSYYDYYQPEAYIPRTDTYIEKETEINEEIDKLRLQATTNLLTRKDTIVVASVSAIYNIGNPREYGKFVLPLYTTKVAAAEYVMKRQDLLLHMVNLHYERSEIGFDRGQFRVKGDTVDIHPSYEDFALRIELSEDKIIKLSKIEPVSGKTLEELDSYVLYPAKHFMTDPETYRDAFEQIRSDLDTQLKLLKENGKEMEAHRLKQRVNYDLEMIAEVGYVNGIENYSRYFDGRQTGEAPYSLLEYFLSSSTSSPRHSGLDPESIQSPIDDYLLIIDESHMTIPQIRGMYNGDRSRKQTLVDFGFRLPSALDNRPLRFDEFLRRKGQTIYTSATPDDWEREQASFAAQTTKSNKSDISHISDEGNAKPDMGIAEQLIRPTGIPDPEVEIRPTNGQIPDLIEEIKKRVSKGQRVLVTTLTKRMSEELTDYLKEVVIASETKQSSPIKVAYLHSDVETLERSSILKKLRLGEHDVLVGINLLREGLDLPEVGLVAILDADKEGFLRSEVSLIQTMGRAARNIDSQVILYADRMTGSIERAVAEVRRRREIQMKWNKDHNIIPTPINKPIREDVISADEQEKSKARKRSFGGFSVLMDHELADINPEELLPEQKKDLAKVLERRMKEAAKILDFEGATFYRDYLKKLV